MGLFDYFRGPRAESGPPAVPEYPWDRRPGVYEHVRAHLRPDGSGLDEAGATLPDEERVSAGSPVRWAPGARDGVATHHMGGSDAEGAAALFGLVRGYCDAPTAANKARVYGFLVGHGVVSLADPFLASLREADGLDHGRLYDLARSLALESPDREPVKFGLALLGAYGRPEDRDVFRTLGRHDEFTLYCAVALANGDDAERELRDLAASVRGWGRVFCVERLAAIAEAPEVRDWLLREGYRNSVMDEYLAHACASAGGLLGALAEDDVDDGLLASAGEILRALIAGGPAEGIDDYEDAAAAVGHYLRHAERRAATAGDFLTVAAIRRYLRGDQTAGGDETDAANPEDGAGGGWPPGLREEVLSRCREILVRPEWPGRVAAWLASDDPVAFHEATRAAAELGIDAWPRHWERLTASPDDAGRWFHVLHGQGGARAAEAIAFAERTLPLAAITTGPGTESGLGPGFEPHRCLGYVLQELGRFPGRGARLVEAGLRSPVVANRNMSLRALSTWGGARWPPGMRDVLERSRDAEPDDDVRRRIENLLAGRPLDAGEPGDDEGG